jgi:hypothetical protein
MTEVQKFINRVNECVKEYRKLQRETDGTDSEIAHFFSSRNKNWLYDHEDDINSLSVLNCEKPFMSFVTHYIYQ